MLLLLQKLLTSAQIVIGVVGIVPIDVHLAIVPVHIRHIAILVARTRLFA